MSEPRRERYSYFYLDPKYQGDETRSSPLKVARIYLAQAPLPHFSMLYIFALFAGAALVASPQPLGLSDAFAVVIAGVSGLAALWIFNLLDDVMDQDADCIAHPDRPLPKGLVARRDVVSLAALLIVTSVTLNAFLSWQAAAGLAGLLLVNLTIQFLAARVRAPGFSELLTPLMWSALPLYVFWVISPQEMGLAALLAVFQYLTDLAQDVPGGVTDAEGDRRQGVRTLTLALGPARAAVIGLIALAVGAAPLFAFFAAKGLPAAAWVVEALILAWTVWTYLRFVNRPTARNCSVARAMAFHYMALTYIVMGAVVLTRLSS